MVHPLPLSLLLILFLVSLLFTRGKLFNGSKRPIIFFLDTSGERDEPFFLTRCAVASAAHHNPEHQVIVYSNGFAAQTWSDISPNIHILPFEPLVWMKKQPKLSQLKNWFQSKESKQGFALNNIADAMRLVLLYLHGGTYFDTDILSIKPLSNLGNHQNVVAWQYEHNDLNFLKGDVKRQINVATLINFEQSFSFISTMLERFVKELDPRKWGHQGPGLITRVYMDANERVKKKIKLLEKNTVNLVGWNEVHKFFWGVKDGTKGAEILRSLKRYSTLVHLWGSQVGKQLPFVKNNHVLSHLYSLACPVTYEKYFLTRSPPTFPTSLIKNIVVSPDHMKNPGDEIAVSTSETNGMININTLKRFHNIVLNNTKIIIKYPTVGLQVCVEDEMYNMVFSTQLELNAETVLQKAGYLLNIEKSNELLQEMNRYLRDDVLMCFGIPNELRRCRATTSQHNFGHILQPGHYLIYAWLETKEHRSAELKEAPIALVSSPTSMMAVTYIIVCFHYLKMMEQEQLIQQVKVDVPLSPLSSSSSAAAAAAEPLIPIQIEVANPQPFTQVSSNFTVVLNVVTEQSNLVENQKSLQEWLNGMASTNAQNGYSEDKLVNLHVCLAISSLHFPLEASIRRLGCVEVFDLVNTPYPSSVPVRLSPKLEGLLVTMVPYGEHDLVVDVHTDDGFGRPNKKGRASSTTVRFLSTPIVKGKTKVGDPYPRRDRKDHLKCLTMKKRRNLGTPVRQYRSVSSEFSQAYKTQYQQQMVGSITMGILVYRGAKSFSDSVKSWYDANLSLYVSEIVVYLQEWPFPDDMTPRSLAEVAKVDVRLMPMLLAASSSTSFPSKVVVLGAPRQVNIAPALSRLVKASSSELFMFLEEDFIIDEQILITKINVQKRLREATQLLLSSSNPVDVVRLRSKQVPGVPDCGRSNWKGKEKEMLNVRSGDIARHKVLDAVSWLDNPLEHFPKNVVWDCTMKKDNNNEKWWCAHSTHAGWTNNPFIVRRDWILREIVPIANVDWTKRVESAVCLSPILWDHGCHVVASGEGIFTHRDIDQPLNVQSPCERPRIELLPDSE
jgi:hypothetical protein